MRPAACCKKGGQADKPGRGGTRSRSATASPSPHPSFHAGVWGSRCRARSACEARTAADGAAYCTGPALAAAALPAPPAHPAGFRAAQRRFARSLARQAAQCQRPYANIGLKEPECQRRRMAARKPSGRKIRLQKKTRQTTPVPAWIIMRTKRRVRTNPKRRAWRQTDVEVG